MSREAFFIMIFFIAFFAPCIAMALILMVHLLTKWLFDKEQNND